MEWKFIIKNGEKTRFEISDTGIVRTLFWGKYHKEVRQTLRSGYKRVGLQMGGYQEVKSVHRLVAEYFIPNPNGYTQVNHINAIKDDNRVENLEWCTPAMNMRHATDNNLIRFTKFTNKVSKRVGRYIGDLLDKEYSSLYQTNKEYPSTSVTRAIENGKNYKGYTWKFIN